MVVAGSQRSGLAFRQNVKRARQGCCSLRSLSIEPQESSMKRSDTAREKERASERERAKVPLAPARAEPTTAMHTGDAEACTNMFPTRTPPSPPPEIASRSGEGGETGDCFVFFWSDNTELGKGHGVPERFPQDGGIGGTGDSRASWRGHSRSVACMVRVSHVRFAYRTYVKYELSITPYKAVKWLECSRGCCGHRCGCCSYGCR